MPFNNRIYKNNRLGATMDILSTSVGVLIGLVTISIFKNANAGFA